MTNEDTDDNLDRIPFSYNYHYDYVDWTYLVLVVWSKTDKYKPRRPLPLPVHDGPGTEAIS